MVMQFKLIKQRSETNLIAFARDNYSREKVEKSRRMTGLQLVIIDGKK